MDWYDRNNNSNHKIDCASPQQSSSAESTTGKCDASPTELSAWAAHEEPPDPETLMRAIRGEDEPQPFDPVLGVANPEYLNLPATVRAPVRSTQRKIASKWLYKR